jgi:hypothetical protein
LWKLFEALAKAMLQHPVYRRKLMFFVSLATMGLAFCGMVILDDFLTEEVWLFLGYWTVTGLLVLLMLLLALYDMLRIRRHQSARELRELADVLKEVEKLGKNGK